MTLYHLVPADQLSSVLAHGLRQGTRGSKGNDSRIIHTDHLLNDLRPPRLTAAGLSRSGNIYAYLPAADYLIDIADGAAKPPPALIGLEGHRLLRLEVDPAYCFVSDLDTFDAVLQAQQAAATNLRSLAAAYWHKLTPLPEYRSQFRRPEVMITRDVSPQAVAVA
jgi:hypothetical protein